MMPMINNYYTVFISPPKPGKTKRFSFRKSTFYILIFLLFFFIVGNYIAIVKCLESITLKNENTKLKAEREELGKIAQIVDEIEKNESFIRDFLGLKESGSSMGGLGLGGVDPNFIDTSYTIPLDSDITVSYKNSERKKSLTEKALCLKKDLQELIDELIDRKSEWDTRPTIMPVKTDAYWISSGFGWRESPFTGLREFHRGLDISAMRGTPIIAPADGIVISASKRYHIGKFIEIKHNDKYSTLYGHLLQHKVEKGQKVKRGDIIGLMGTTGMSTGYHLHYEVRKDSVSINPCNYILDSSAIMAMH